VKSTVVEFRVRHRRAPGGDFRIVLGVARTKADAKRLDMLREVCVRLAARGEWDTLGSIKARTITADEVARLVDAHGWEDYRTRLDIRPLTSGPTLDAHSDRWLTGIKKGTVKVYGRDILRLRNFRVDGHRLGDRAWHDVYPHHIRDALDSLRGTMELNTVRTVLGGWGSFFTWAIRRERSEALEASRTPAMILSPVRGAESWGAPEITRHRFLSREEFRRLLDGTIPPMRAQYAALVLGGFRVEEFMRLPPAHVRIPSHFHVGPWGDWAPKGYPRHKHGVRDVPIHAGVLLPLLEEYARRWAGDVTFFVDPRSGAPWSYARLTKRLRLDVVAVGMIYGQRKAGERQPEGITPHVFRHTLASWLAQDDVQLMKIARVLGDTEETVRKHYAHLFPADLERAVNRLDLA